MAEPIDWSGYENAGIRVRQLYGECESQKQQLYCHHTSLSKAIPQRPLVGCQWAECEGLLRGPDLDTPRRTSEESHANTDSEDMTDYRTR